MIEELATLLSIYTYHTDNYVAFKDSKTLYKNPIKNRLVYDQSIELDKKTSTKVNLKLNIVQTKDNRFFNFEQT